MLRKALCLSWFAALVAVCASNAAADGFGPEIRIGNYGTVPGIVFAPDGTGHLVYRRGTNIHYRRYDGANWGAEKQVNDTNSRAEAEFLDRNQPKITLAPNGVAYMVWGGSVRSVDKNVYMRAVNPDGNFRSGIKKYQHKPELLNPEEVAVSFDPTTNRLHVYNILVGDPTKAEDGHYDLTINPETLELQSAKGLGPPQKNVYGLTGDRRAFAFARLHQMRFYRSKDNGSYEETLLRPTKLQYSVGAMRFTTNDDRFIHFGIVSTNPTNGAERDVTYLYFDANTKTQLGEAMVDPQFDSPHGLAFPAVTPSGNLFMTYDSKRQNGRHAPIYAVRSAGAPPNGAFSQPAVFPDYPADASCEAPMPFALGESIYVVWGDKIRDGLFARVYTFDGAAPVPSSTMLGWLALVLAGGVILFQAARRAGRGLRPTGMLLLTVLATACGGGDEGPDGPDPTPTPALRTSIGYQLLDGLDRLGDPKVGVARLYSSHNPSDAANRDYNWYRRRDPDGSYVLVDHAGPGVITRIWMTGWQGPRLQTGEPGFSSDSLISVYVDGSTTPLFSINPNRFFAGQLFPFVAPLVGQHTTAKGFFSYVPISFTSSVKVTLTGDYPPNAGSNDTRLFFYQINVLALTGQNPVVASPTRQGDGSLALSAEDQAAHQQALAQWRDPLAFANRMTEAPERASFPGPVSGTANLANLTGPGRIRGLRLRTAGVSPADLERVRLRIFWDGEAAPSVDFPVGTGWSQHFNRGQYQALTQGSLSDGTLYLRLPMPFRQSARVELVSSGGALPISSEIFWERGSVASDARYLHAFSTEGSVRGATRLTTAQASGAGHVIGLHLVVDVASDSHALEGDEFIVIDGTSQYEGTGTEDFFNSHWFFAGGLRSQPLNGATSTGSRTRPDVDAYRWMLPDLVPFGSNMSFQIENGNDANNVDLYRSVVFYYLGQ